MAVVNGTEVMVFASPSSGTTAWGMVGHATSHTLSIKMASRDTSNKGTLNYVTKANGRLDVTASLEGMYLDSDSYNLENFMLAQVARTPLLLIFGKPTTAGGSVPDTTTSGGTHFYASGQFLITGVDATFPDQANSTYSVSFEHYTGFQLNKLITT